MAKPFSKAEQNDVRHHAQYFAEFGRGTGALSGKDDALLLLRAFATIQAVEAERDALQDRVDDLEEDRCD